MATQTQGYASQVQNYTDALNQLTLPSIEDNKLYDTFFDSSPLFALMNNTGCAVERSGGTFFQEQFNTSKSPNASWYSQGQSWNISEYNGFVDGGWEWCFAHDAAMITLPELVRNEGSKEAIVDLVQARLDVSNLTLPDLIANSLYVNSPYGTNSDGSASISYAIEGLAVAVDNGTISGTVGNISRSAYPTLNAQANYNAAQGTSFLSQVQSVYTSTWKGNSSSPNIVLSNQSNYNYLWGTLQPNERFYQSLESLEAQGYKVTGGMNIGFNNAVWYVDIKCPTGVQKPVAQGGSGGYIYVLDTKTFKFITHPRQKFSIGEWYKDQNAAVFYVDLYWAGAFICTDPRRNGVLWVSGG